MFVQRHLPRHSHHYQASIGQHHKRFKNSRVNHHSATSAAAPPPTATLSSHTNAPLKRHKGKVLEWRPEWRSNPTLGTLRDKSSSFRFYGRNLHLNGVKLRRSESLPAAEDSCDDSSWLKAGKRHSCDWILLTLLRRRRQSTGAHKKLERRRKTRHNPLDSETTIVKEEAGCSGESMQIRATLLISSIKNIWGFSYFWFDFLAYQVETWRLIAENTLPIKRGAANKIDTIKAAIERGNSATLDHNEHHLRAQLNPAPAPQRSLMFNHYYVAEEAIGPVQCTLAAESSNRYVPAAAPAGLLEPPTLNSNLGVRNPLYRNLSLNADSSYGHTYYMPLATGERPQQRPCSSRAEYRTSTELAALNYRHSKNFYHQTLSADSINNSKPYKHHGEHLYTQPSSSTFYASSSPNHLAALTGFGQSTSRRSKGSPRLATLASPPDYYSSALQSFDYSAEEASSLPVTEVELRSRQLSSSTNTNHYASDTYARHQSRSHRLYQPVKPSERSTSSMSYHRTYSEAVRKNHSFEQGSPERNPRIASDSDLTRNRFNGKSNSVPLKSDRYYHVHSSLNSKSIDKAQRHLLSTTPSASQQDKARSLQQGPRKANSPSLKLSLTGAKKRLGFKQSGSTALIVQRSEEILPTEHNSFLIHQLNSHSPTSSSETNQSFFIEGLGPGQIVSRQGLVSPYLGDIQLTLTDRRGMLEVEVVRVRRLQMKAGAESLPAPYVKIYLMKDKKCIAKWKTSTVARTLDPLYQEQFIFREDYADCILQVIVWGYYGKRDKKSLMGVVQIHLNDIDISKLVIGWYKLFNAPSMTNSLHSSKNLRQMLTKNLTIAN